MSFSLGSNCKLVLYYQDKRISETKWSETTELSLSKQTAGRAHDTICGYFQVANEWDKKLFKSAFSSDSQFDWFEFAREESPEVTCGIKFFDNRNVVFIESPETFGVLDRGERKIHVSVKSVLGNNDYDLALEDLRGKKKDDQAIVALYNSESFIKHSQCSTNIGFARLLEIIK